MATTVLVATTDAADSDEITVGDTPVAVVAVCDNAINFDYQAILKVKGGETFQPVFDPDLVSMGKLNHQLFLTMPGTYIISKDATPLGAIGFETTP